MSNACKIYKCLGIVNITFQLLQFGVSKNNVDSLFLGLFCVDYGDSSGESVEIKKMKETLQILLGLKR